YETVNDPDWPLRSVYEGLAPASGFGGIDHEAEIRRAIEDRDREALYAASTRALSQLTRYWLRQAGKELERPGEALEAVLQAQRIYR
ncbi:hypothetical protein MYX77_14455, partial [Acidobacteriia bacterium AH_259_A11_L15]|nr:hypothetical protein [Acidobacteriia bacterium AH_259_A11_L15]